MFDVASIVDRDIRPALGKLPLADEEFARIAGNVRPYFTTARR